MPVGTLANMATSAFVRTPPPLAERIVRHLLAFPEGKAVNVLDPTAGEGDLLYPCLSFPRARLFGVEISTARTQTARARLVGAEVVAAAFEGVSLPRGSMSLVLCNPPYFFQNGERAEYRIIAESGQLLMPGGIMAAIIPARSAWDGTLINHFCKWYERVQVWKFPDRESADDEAAFEDFTQIVVLGIRRAEPCDLIPAEQRRLSGFRYRASAPKSNPRLRLGWERGTPPPVLPDTPIADPYAVPEALVRPQIVVRHANEASLLAALEKSGAHLSAWWEEATTWEMERLRGQPIMPLSGEAHVAAEVLTGLLDGEILRGPGGGTEAEPHLLTAFVGHEWATMQVDEEEREKLREHGVVSVSVRQWQDKPILGVLNLATGETRYEQGDGVFSFLSPWLGRLAARVAARRVPLYQLDPAEWEMRVLSQFGQDKQLPNATFPGLSAAQQHRVYALGRSLDISGRAAIQGEPGVGKTRLAMATAARMAYQWRHRSTPPFLGTAKQPAWMRGLRQAWLKNPSTLAMLGLEAVREAGTGRLIAYRRADGTLLAPEDAGPEALPVLVTTPKKVTKEYAAEIRAAWKEVGAEVMLIESHRDIPRWLARCAHSSAPAVVAVFPHSLTRAFGRAWQPAVQEKEILSEVKVTEPDDAVRDRLRPVTDEQGKLVGYQWKRSDEWYTRLESATRFYCPDCGGMIKAIPGKLHEVENQPTDEEEGIVLFKKRQVGKLEQEDDRLEPVTSRTWLTLKPRWCHCRSDRRQEREADPPPTKPRRRTALWTDARLPAAQRKHPQPGFVSWSQAVSRVQQQASHRAAQATTAELIQLAREDEAILQRLVTAAHQGEMDESTFDAFRPLRNHPAALASQLEAARPALSLDPCFFRLLWQTAFPSQKKGKGCQTSDACSLAVVAQSSKAASGEKGKGVKQSAKTRREWIAERRAALEQERREREGERYVTAAPLADSFSPYDYLYRFYKGCVALAIVDESHNGRGRDTDIAHAFHQAMLASQTRMLATGTHFGGDILGFYHYWYRFHPQFWKRLGLGWNDAEKALSQYGVVQEWTKTYESDARRGSGQTNVQVSTIPAPGLSAKLIPYLLEDLVYLAVLDVGAHMPARIEIPEIVSMHDAAIEEAQALAAAKRRDVQAQLATVKRASKGSEVDENEQGAEVGRLQRVVEQAMEQEAAVRAWAEPRHLAAHYWRLVRRLEDLARERNQAARLAKGTVPRWFAALPCDQPFEVTQTTRDDWGDVIGRQLLIRTESLEWDYLYPLEKRLIAIVQRERAEGRRVMLYYEQNDLRSMARRLQWVLREYGPWTLPNIVAAEDRQQAIMEAVLQQGHDVVIVPYRRVNEGLNLQGAVDTILWVEMALNLFMLDQASRRAWRLGKREEVRIYYLAYANTAGHRKLRKLGQQSGAAAAFAGEVATGALVQEAGADKTTLARLSSLLQDEQEGASLILDEDEGELVQEEADLKAAFARRAEELQAALKAGRTFLGGIEDTLEERLNVLRRDSSFTAPVWQGRPRLHPVLLKAMVPSTQQQRQRERRVEASPVRATPPARGPQDEVLCPSQPATPSMVPSPTLPPVALPLAAKATGRVSVEFGNLDHIAAFARRRPRRVRSYDPVKRSAPLVERDIPALDDTPSAAQQSHKPLAPVMPSLWDVFTATTEEPAPAGKPALQSPLSSPLPSTPRQSGLWE